MNIINNEGRYQNLDALRGIMCLQVVFGHALNCFSNLTWMYMKGNECINHDWLFYTIYSPLHFLFSGISAVKVFFILSGFVLSIPLYQADISKSQYFKFFNRRILRLYLPCLAIILISLLVKITYYNPSATIKYGGFIKGILSSDFSGQMLVKTFFLGGNVTNLNPVLWTLPIEIKLSLILPFFVIVLRRINGFFSVSTIVGMIVLNMIIKRLGLYNVVSDLSILYYITFFLIGSLICKYRMKVTECVNSINSFSFFILLIVSLFMYTFEYSMWWLPNNLLHSCMRYNDYIVAAAGTLFLCFTLGNRFNRVLNNVFFKFIGEISFSLYLSHTIIFLSCVYLLTNFINPYLVIGIALSLSIPISFLFYRFVEIPSLNFSKYLSNKLYAWVNYSFNKQR